MTRPTDSPHDLLRHAEVLAALGHEARLQLFHLLVRAGHDGLPVGALGAHSGLAPSTLAHHLRALTGAGLVAQERQGRSTLCRADFGALEGTLSFLTAECCEGVTLIKEAS